MIVPIDLTPFEDAIAHAIEDGTVCVVATSGAGGIPDIALKGSVIVYDNEHLAFWERVRGRQYEQLREGPGIAVLYFNRQRRMLVRFFGEAELHEAGLIRDDVLERAPKAETDRDPERKGLAVLIRVDRVEDPLGAGRQER